MDHRLVGNRKNSADVRANQRACAAFKAQHFACSRTVFVLGGMDGISGFGRCGGRLLRGVQLYLAGRAAFARVRRRECANLDRCSPRGCGAPCARKSWRRSENVSPPPPQHRFLPFGGRRAQRTENCRRNAGGAFGHYTSAGGRTRENARLGAFVCRI